VSRRRCRGFVETQAAVGWSGRQGRVSGFSRPFRSDGTATLLHQLLESSVGLLLPLSLFLVSLALLLLWSGLRRPPVLHRRLHESHRRRSLGSPPTSVPSVPSSPLPTILPLSTAVSLFLSLPPVPLPLPLIVALSENSQHLVLFPSPPPPPLSPPSVLPSPPFGIGVGTIVKTAVGVASHTVHCEEGGGGEQGEERGGRGGGDGEEMGRREEGFMRETTGAEGREEGKRK